MRVPSSFLLLLLIPSSYSPHRTAVTSGLAQDRGLSVPDTPLPSLLQSWSHADLATAMIRKFVGEDKVPQDMLANNV